MQALKELVKGLTDRATSPYRPNRGTPEGSIDVPYDIRNVDGTRKFTIIEYKDGGRRIELNVQDSQGVWHCLLQVRRGERLYLEVDAISTRSPFPSTMLSYNEVDKSWEVYGYGGAPWSSPSHTQELRTLGLYAQSKLPPLVDVETTVVLFEQQLAQQNFNRPEIVPRPSPS